VPTKASGGSRVAHPALPLNDPAFYASDPFDAYRLLRDDCPLYWFEGAGFWTITRHADVLYVSRDHQTFCNGHGMTMRGSELEDVKGGETLITTDPPRHTAERHLVHQAFSPRQVAKLAPRVRQVARDTLAGVPEGETFDLVDRVAASVPVIVIAELLGVPVEDQEKFIRWSNAGVGVADPDYADLRVEAMTEQYAYFEALLRERRRQPRDDLLTVIAEAAREDTDFDQFRALTLCFLLLAAGNETTRNLVTHGFTAVARHPDQLWALREGLSSRLAVDELLRFTSPVIHMARTVTAEVELHGETLHPGDQVVMLYGAANRDDRVFGKTAEELHLDRSPNPQVSFGFGQHFCLGAALARLEARIVFEELAAAFGAWEVVGPPEHLQSTMVRGIKHLPVQVAR